MVNENAVRFEIHDEIAYLILDTPPANSMSDLFFKKLTDITKKCFDGLDVKGMIVYGQGRHFSSGAIIPEITSVCQSECALEILHEHAESFRRIENLPFPVVAAISGCCIGSGLELALSCHYRIAAERSVFSLPESTFGLIPGCGGSVRLTQITTVAKAIELLISGRTFLADEALEAGIIDYIIPRNKLLETAQILIGKLHSEKI